MNLKMKKFIQSEKNTHRYDISSDVYLPDEIITIILSFVDKKTLVEVCRFVCKKWCKLVTSRVWKVKAEREHGKIFSELKIQTRLPWSIYHSIIWSNPYGKNFLKNNTGQNEFLHWNILINGGHNWKVETPPIGVPVNEFSSKIPKCFATSFSECAKRQLIDLNKIGLTGEIMDTYQPNIVISEWYAARFDCDSFYELNVGLLNMYKKVVVEFEFKTKLTAGIDSWTEVKHTFEDYGPEVRYISFYHAGKDAKFWAGHYGSKMANASVEIPISALGKLQIKYDVLNDETVF